MKIIVGSSSLFNKPEFKKYREPLKNIPFSKFHDYGMNYPPLPIDDSDGGVEIHNPNFDRKSVSLHSAIELEDGDCISGHPKEIVNYINNHNIKHLLIAGVHLNMCILDRPYAIKNLLRYGVPLSIMRDFTDPVYNCKGKGVTRDEIKGQLLDYIEKYYCPTTSSNDIFLYEKG